LCTTDLTLLHFIQIRTVVSLSYDWKWIPEIHQSACYIPQTVTTVNILTLINIGHHSARSFGLQNTYIKHPSYISAAGKSLTHSHSLSLSLSHTHTHTHTLSHTHTLRHTHFGHYKMDWFYRSTKPYSMKFIHILFKIWSQPIETLSCPCYLNHSGKGEYTDYFTVKEVMQIGSGWSTGMCFNT